MHDSCAEPRKLTSCNPATPSPSPFFSHVLVFGFELERLKCVSLKDAMPWTDENTAAFSLGDGRRTSARNTSPQHIASLKTAVELANAEAALPRESRMAGKRAAAVEENRNNLLKDVTMKFVWSAVETGNT